LLLCHLKTILDLIDLSQQELADELNKSRNTVTSWTKGVSPKLDTALDVVDLLNKKAALKGLEKRWTIEEVWQRRPI
jgi:DNA-binding XRE family transcriptional regulator